MQFFGILFLAVIVEGIVGWAQAFYRVRKIHWPCLVALLIGITLCLGTGTDLFVMVGIPIRWPYVGAVLTGLLVSRGSEYIRSLMGKLGTEEKNVQKSDQK